MKNRYPIPNANKLFDRLNGMQIFSKLDLRSEYHQVQIKVRDEPKMPCIMHYGSYEFTVMTFGLTNIPTTFCALMNHVFCAFLDKFIMVYPDDILIFNKSMEEHKSTYGQSLRLFEPTSYFSIPPSASLTPKKSASSATLWATGKSRWTSPRWP